MDAVNRHYRLSIRLMTWLGVWPYVYSRFRHIRSSIVNFAVSLLIFVQFTALTCGSYEIDITIVLQTLCFTLIIIGNLMKFNSFLKNGDAVRYLMDSIKNTWSTVHEDTLEILERRTNLGRKQAVFFTIFLYPAAISLIICRTASYLLVIITPPEANLTDPFPVLTDYLVPHEKYFTWIVLHQNVAIFLTATIPAATETLYIMWLQHSICLFELASYYFEKGVADKPSTTSTKEMEVYRHECFASAVRYQNEGYHLCTVSGILELSLSLCLGIQLTFSFQSESFVAYVKEKFTFSYGLLILISVVSLAMNLFRISTAIRVTHDMQELFSVTILTAVQFFYMCYLNYLMQNVGDYAVNLSSVVYGHPWYNRSVAFQKGILLVLLGSSRSISFDYYGFYSATLEGFSSLMKLAMSYFTLMLSFQSDD